MKTSIISYGEALSKKIAIEIFSQISKVLQRETEEFWNDSTV